MYEFWDMEVDLLVERHRVTCDIQLWLAGLLVYESLRVIVQNGRKMIEDLWVKQISPWYRTTVTDLRLIHMPISPYSIPLSILHHSVHSMAKMGVLRETKATISISSRLPPTRTLFSPIGSK